MPMEFCDKSLFPRYMKEMETLTSKGYSTIEEVLDAVFARNIVFPLQRRRELERALEIVGKLSPRTITEIGTDKGTTFFSLLWLSRPKRAFGIDIRGFPFSSLFERYFPDVRFDWIEGSSFDTSSIERVRNLLGDDKIDFLFIDGNHTRAKSDFDKYRGMVSKGGVVMLHDIKGDIPGNVLEDCKKHGYRTEEIIDITEYEESIRNKYAELGSRGYRGWLEYWKGRGAGIGVIYL